MSELGSVQFDEMEVNTNLALEYFKQKNNRIRSVTKLSVTDLSQESDGYNKIFITTFEEKTISAYVDFERCSLERSNIIHQQLLKLAKLIEQNAELFAQIEYLIRKIPVEEVKNYDIKLTVQNLSCRNYLTGEQSIYKHAVHGINMNEESPLANVGFVGQLLMSQSKVLIFATKKTAATCYLFSELCQAVGLDSVEVIFVAKDQSLLRDYCDLSTVPTLKDGCVGVITERSDFDSAVDVLLRTTTRYPWKLTRIYVQESIYDRFKKVMAWKCGSTPETVDQADTLKRLCDNLYVYDGKAFLVDYAGVSSSIDSGKVLVEAYRTTKDLITLVTKYGAPYISLWSSDVSESNEIAHKVPSSIVWINSYGIFDGPPNSSQAIYKELYKDVNVECDIAKKDLAAQQASWSKKTFESRRASLYTALTEILEKNPSAKDIEELRVAVRNLENDDFVCVENGRICVGISVPEDIVLVEYDTEWEAPHMAKLLSTGAAVVYPYDDKPLSYLNLLSPYIPVSTFSSDHNSKSKKFSPIATRTKIIWTNFGTIFAN